MGRRREFSAARWATFFPLPGRSATDDFRNFRVRLSSRTADPGAWPKPRIVLRAFGQSASVFSVPTNEPRRTREAWYLWVVFHVLPRFCHRFFPNFFQHFGLPFFEPGFFVPGFPVASRRKVEMMDEDPENTILDTNGDCCQLSGRIGMDVEKEQPAVFGVLKGCALQILSGAWTPVSSTNPPLGHFSDHYIARLQSHRSTHVQ